jgi:hypothetical protein
MPEFFEHESEQGVAQRVRGDWRVVASAWALAIAVVMLFTGMQAVASWHTVVPAQQERLVGAMIPRHDPSCADLTVPATPSCRATSDDLAKAEAEAEVGASYGW